MTRTLLSFVFVASLGFPAAAGAQMTGAPTAGYRAMPGAPASTVPAPLREIGFDQNLDRQLPLDLPFLDDQGRSVRLGEFFGQKPVILAFVYYDCPMLCTLVLNSLASTLDTLSLDVGKDFDVVAVSFDARETPAQAAKRRAATMERYKRPGTDHGWHFLTGSHDSIAALTSAAGFRFAWDEDTKQFAHPTGIIVTTPGGKPARYVFGLEYGPRDVRLALVEASQGVIGSPVDSLLLYCYHYDPMTGRYGLVIMRALRIAGGATVLGIGAFIFLMTRRDRRVRGVPASPSSVIPKP